MIELMKIIMWRTSKRDAKIGVADPEIHFRVLDFGMAERQNYNKAYSDMADLLAQGRDAKHLNRELQKLRHLCDHFQIGRKTGPGKKGGAKDDDETFATVKKTLNLEDLKQMLQEEEKQEYLEATRSYIFQKLAVAGCLMLKKDFKQAMVVYKEVIDHKVEDGRIDSLQMLHAAHNYLEASKTAHIPKDPNVAAIVAKIEKKYSQNKKERATQSIQKLESISAHLNSFPVKKEPWWSKTLRAMDQAEITELIGTVYANLAQRSALMAARVGEARSASGVQVLIHSLLEEMLTARNDILKEFNVVIKSLLKIDSNAVDLMQELKNCSRCHKELAEAYKPHPYPFPNCRFCEFETNHIIPYERKIWLFDDNLCPKCFEGVAIHQNTNDIDLGDEEKLSEEELKGKTQAQLKELCKDHDLEVKGNKKDLIERLLDNQMSNSVQMNSLLCVSCDCWWHLRCVPKHLQTKARDALDSWNCPQCLGISTEVQRKHEAGRVRHNSLVHQILQLLQRKQRKVLENKCEEEVSAHLKTFKEIHEEAQQMRNCAADCQNMILSYDELAQSKSRLTFADDEENESRSFSNFQKDDDDEDSEEKKSQMLVSGTIARRMVDAELANFRDLMIEADQARKTKLSKFRFLKSDGAQDQCPICLCDFEEDNDVYFLPCNHITHSHCHDKWAKSGHQICAVCRSQVRMQDVKKMKKGQFEVFAKVPVKQRESIANVDDDEEPVLGVPFQPAIGGGYGVKLTALIHDIHRCFLSEEPARIVIFSQFEEMLTHVKGACVENGIPVISGSPQKSVPKFKEKAKKQKNVVLLLPVARGAEGLTLIEGNIVMILEPCFPSALEQQAIARIHRIGQTQQTHVYKYVVRKTVEQRLCEIALQEEDQNPEDFNLLDENVIHSILLPPAEEFEPIVGPPKMDEGELEDRDELWWKRIVLKRGKPLSRRDALETYLKMDDDCKTVILHGVEIPEDAMRNIMKLPLQNPEEEKAEEEEFQEFDDGIFEKIGKEKEEKEQENEMLEVESDDLDDEFDDEQDQLSIMEDETRKKKTKTSKRKKSKFDIQPVSEDDDDNDDNDDDEDQEIRWLKKTRKRADLIKLKRMKSKEKQQNDSQSKKRK